MRRRSGEVLVIGEERLDEGALPFDEDDEGGDVESAVEGSPRVAKAVAGMRARSKRMASQRRLRQAALGFGALVALGGTWLAVGLGSSETRSPSASDRVGAVPLVGERQQAPSVGRAGPQRAGAARSKRPSSGGTAAKGAAPRTQGVGAQAPTPTGGAPTTPPSTSPGPAVPADTVDPAPASPTPASAATVQREFGP